MNQQFPSIGTDVRLVPVIELAPVDFARDDRMLPPHPSSDETWDQYWLASLADSGISGLQPIQPRSWHVPLAQLTEAHILEQILRTHCFQDEEESSASEIDPDNLIAFSGGYALYIGDQIMITPRCCADLADIEQWHLAANHRHAARGGIWIGHPSIAVEFDGTHLIFSEEENGHPTEWPGECSVDPLALQQAIRKAEQDLLTFFELLLPIVANMSPSGRAVETTEILTACDSLRLHSVQ